MSDSVIVVVVVVEHLFAREMLTPCAWCDFGTSCSVRHLACAAKDGSTVRRSPQAFEFFKFPTRFPHQRSSAASQLASAGQHVRVGCESARERESVCVGG